MYGVLGWWASYQVGAEDTLALDSPLHIYSAVGKAAVGSTRIVGVAYTVAVVLEGGGTV